MAYASGVALPDGNSFNRSKHTMMAYEGASFILGMVEVVAVMSKDSAKETVAVGCRSPDRQW